MSCWGWQLGLSGMRDRFSFFGAVIRIRKLSLFLVMTLRIPNSVALSSASHSRHGASNRVCDAEPHAIVPSLRPSVPCSAPVVSLPEPAMAPPPWPQHHRSCPLVHKAGPWTPPTPPRRVAINAAKTLLTLAILRKSPCGFCKLTRGPE